MLFANEKKEEMELTNVKDKKKCYMCEFNKCFMYKVNCFV
jgi:hypothetical protein